MNHPADDNLVTGFLEGLLTDDEAALLDQRLAEDPRLAERLADACRVEVCLASLLGQDGASVAEQPTQPAVAGSIGRPLRRSRMIQAAAIALLAAGAMIAMALIFRSTNDPASSTVAVESGRVLVDGQAVDRLRHGQSLEVASDAVLALTDGSKARLDAHTRAVLHGPASEVRQRVEITEGGGAFTVAKGQGEFTVETSLGRVTALGTEFSAHLRPAAARKEGDRESGDRPRGSPEPAVLAVSVSHGSVRVEANDRVVVLAAGESRTFARGKSDREGEGRGEPKGEHRRTLRGRFGGLREGRLVLMISRESREPEHRLLDLSPSLKVTLDGRAASVVDVPPGREVQVTLDEGMKTVKELIVLPAKGRPRGEDDDRGDGEREPNERRAEPQRERKPGSEGSCRTTPAHPGQAGSVAAAARLEVSTAALKSPPLLCDHWLANGIRPPPLATLTLFRSIPCFDAAF